MNKQNFYNQRTKGIVLVLTGATLWGASGVTAQYLFHNKFFTPEWLVVVRLIVSGILLLIFDYYKYYCNIFKIWTKPYDRNQLILFGILGMLSVQYTYFAAIKYGNAATATILQYLMPAIIVCYVAFRNKRLPTCLELFSLVLAIIGTFLLVTKGKFNSLAISPPALFWGILSAFSAAFYTLQPRYLLSQWRSTLVIGWGMLIGGIAMIPVNPPWQFSGSWDLSAFLGIAFIIIFGTVIAFYTYLESIRYISPTETGTIACVEPLSAVILSIYFLNVPFGFIDCIGGLCILSTIFILAKK